MYKNYKVVYLLRFSDARKTLRGKRIVSALSKLHAKSKTEDLEKKNNPKGVIEFEKVGVETILGFMDFGDLDDILNF